jgi:hypothetical protein
MTLFLRAGAIAVRDGMMFSDTSRNVFLMEPDCSGNESLIAECPNSSVPCISQGGVGVICQGESTFRRTFLCMWVFWLFLCMGHGVIRVLNSWSVTPLNRCMPRPS